MQGEEASQPGKRTGNAQEEQLSYRQRSVAGNSRTAARGCAQKVELDGLNEKIVASSATVNEASIWLMPESSVFSNSIGVRLFVKSSKPADIAKAIEDISPTLLTGIDGSKFTVSIRVVPGHSFDYADYFATEEAVLKVMVEVSNLLGVEPAGGIEVDLSSDELRSMANAASL